MITFTQLSEIFQHQTELARKFHPIELINGYTPPTWPVNIQTRHGQDRLRQFAWWIAEEMGEYWLEPHNSPTRAEELADVLHFHVELCLNIGITPGDVMNHSTLVELEDHPALPHVSEVFIQLVHGINLLKAKPWKQNPAPVDRDQLVFRISRSLHTLLRTFVDLGLDAHILYFAKKKVNEQRILSGV